jgi:hypothetical protein
MPSGTPNTAAMPKACMVRERVRRKSAPIPSGKLTQTDSSVRMGEGSSRGVTQPWVWTRCQSAKSASGPTAIHNARRTA